MDSFADAARRRALKGAIVTEFDCRGCMAQDQVFVRTFRITGFETVNDTPCAVGAVLFENGRSYISWLEHRTVSVPIHHQGLLKIDGNYWHFYK